MHRRCQNDIFVGRWEVVNLPVRVYYPEAGVSNFQMFRDNVRFGVLHSRLCTSGCVAWVKRFPRRYALVSLVFVTCVAPSFSV